MRKERERRTLETAGMLFTLLFGNLLHFVYDWTGQAGWAAYLSAVNESTWGAHEAFGRSLAGVDRRHDRRKPLCRKRFAQGHRPARRPRRHPGPVLYLHRVSWEKAWAWSTS